MKIALINENSQAAKNGIIEAALKKVVEPMGHEVVNYGMYAADDKAQLTYVQCGILAAILLNSGAADYVITGCGTGEGAMLALNSFPGVICGHVEDPVDAYTFAHVNDGNAVAMPFAKGFGWGGELNLEYCFEKLFGFGHGQGIRIPLPGGGQTLADLAAVVVLHQRVHALGAVVQVRVCGADQIVQSGGLTGVQQGVGAAAGAAGGAAGSGRAAAAAQQAGCRCGNNSGTAGFQELAAGNGMTHKKSLFLSDSGLDRMKLPRRHKPKKEATESIRYLFVTAYSYQRVTNASITLNPCGVNRFWAQRRQFLHRQQRQPHR